MVNYRMTIFIKIHLLHSLSQICQRQVVKQVLFLKINRIFEFYPSSIQNGFWIEIFLFFCDAQFYLQAQAKSLEALI